jgi:hypothetical protein
MMSTAPARPLEPPVWFEPLRSPTWLVPPVGDNAAPVVVCAEPWVEHGVDRPGRDLRLGFPLYLAEAIRFGTDARAIALRSPVEQPGAPMPDASLVVRTAVAPDGDGAVRVRITDPAGSIHSEIVREAHDEPTLAAALESLPHPVSEGIAISGVRPVWNSLYRAPSGAALIAYVRGQGACGRVVDGSLPAGSDPESIAARRAETASILKALGSLATSTSEPFTAMVFFGALLAAYDAGSSVVGEFRLQANARCTTATDPVDPVYAMAALVMRVFGDLSWSARRVEGLRSSASPAMQQWLDRIEAVT